jgi:hypothetical protein
VQFDAAESGGQRRADGAGTAAQVHDETRAGRPGQGLFDQELRAAARHEDARVDGDAQAPELGPADDEFEGQARDPALDHGGGFGRGAGGGEDQLGLVLGEDTTRGAQGDDDGVTQGRWNGRHGGHGSQEPFEIRRALRRSPTAGDPRDIEERAPGLTQR